MSRSTLSDAWAQQQVLRKAQCWEGLAGGRKSRPSEDLGNSRQAVRQRLRRAPFSRVHGPAHSMAGWGSDSQAATCMERVYRTV